MYDHLLLDKNEVTTLQIDGPKRQVCVKFAQAHTLTALLDHTLYRDKKKHGAGEISRVSLSTVILGRRMVRVANLPPEMPAEVIQRIMQTFGSVQETTDEKLIWFRKGTGGGNL